MGYSGERRNERAIRGPDQLPQPHHLLFTPQFTHLLLEHHRYASSTRQVSPYGPFPQKLWLRPTSLKILVEAQIISNFPRCPSIQHFITITSSESTPTCCPIFSIVLFPNFQSSVKFSLDIIVNFDQMCQYRPKSSIWKTPTRRERRSKNYLKQITIPNYISFSHDKIIFIYK